MVEVQVPLPPKSDLKWASDYPKLINVDRLEEDIARIREALVPLSITVCPDAELAEPEMLVDVSGTPLMLAMESKGDAMPVDRLVRLASIGFTSLEAMDRLMTAFDTIDDHFDSEGNLKGDGKWRLKSIAQAVKDAQQAASDCDVGSRNERTSEMPHWFACGCQLIEVTPAAVKFGSCEAHSNGMDLLRVGGAVAASQVYGHGAVLAALERLLTGRLKVENPNVQECAPTRVVSTPLTNELCDARWSLVEYDLEWRQWSLLPKRAKALTIEATPRVGGWRYMLCSGGCVVQAKPTLESVERAIAVFDAEVGS